MIAEKNPIKSVRDRLLFTGPTMIAFTLAVLMPFAYGFYLTLMRMNNITDMSFAGMDNYMEAFKDSDFWISLVLTFKYVGATVIFMNILGFALAYLVTTGIKGQNFFRASLFTPNLIGGLLLGYIWKFVFAQSLPALGKALGIELFRWSWLGDAQLAFWAIVIVAIWQNAGFLMIIFIAGLMSVPKDIIEASTIDGANAWQRLTKMVMPMMVPSFVVTIFLTLKNAFMVYDMNFSLTAGGPYNSTKMVSMHVVSKAFDSNNYGVGQAEAIILFIVVATATSLQVYFSKKLEVVA